MSRPLRINYENAWYHVMQRGAAKRRIFIYGKHYRYFLNMLGKIKDRYGIEIHAYCIMSNHYHLLIRTPLANLSESIQYLDGLYAQYFNYTMKSDGPIYRGRFKSKIIADTTYLITTSKYIHLNPVHHEFVKMPQEYKWSSYTAYLNHKLKPFWLTTKNTLDYFGGVNQIEKYRNFVLEEIFFSLTNTQDLDEKHIILGSDSYRKKLAETYFKENKLNKLIPNQKLLLKPLDYITVIRTVTKRFRIKQEQLLYPSYNNQKFARAVAIYLTYKTTANSLPNMSKNIFGLHLKTIEKIIYRIKTKLSNDPKFAREITDLEHQMLHQNEH